MEGVESEYPKESAELLFADNVKYNTLLAKYKTKVNKNLPPRLKEETQPPSGLTPAEVRLHLELNGIKVTDRTLRNYVKQNKIDAPYVKVLGRALGKLALYPHRVVEQILSFKGSEGGQMSPNEVVNCLAAYKIDVSERNLFNWVKMELLPTPETGNRGRAKGKFTDYPTDTLYHYYAAWRMKKDVGLELPDIAAIRRDIITWWNAIKNATDAPNTFFTLDHYAWIAFYRMAIAKIPADIPLVLTRLEDDKVFRNHFPRRANPEALPRIGALIQFDNNPEAKIITHFTPNGQKIQIYPRSE